MPRSVRATSNDGVDAGGGMNQPIEEFLRRVDDVLDRVFPESESELDVDGDVSVSSVANGPLCCAGHQKVVRREFAACSPGPVIDSGCDVSFAQRDLCDRARRRQLTEAWTCRRR